MCQKCKQPTLKRRSQRLIEAKAPKKRRPSPENTIRQTTLALPTEILLLIIDKLSLPWKFSLALACKSLTELTHRSTLPRLQREELAEFLPALQKDIPNVFFCYCCYKLRLFDPNLGWENQAHATSADGLPPSIIIGLPHSCKNQHVPLPQQFHQFMSNTSISFMEANLVMGRHFHGFSHGIPLQGMERHESFEGNLELGQCVRFRRDRRCNYRGHACSHRGWLPKPKSNTKTQLPGDSLVALQKKKDTWRFFFPTIPKIIDNKLYIARFFTITGPLVSEERLKKVTGSMSISICRHLTCLAYPSCCYRRNSLPNRLANCLSIQLARDYLQDDGKAVEFDPEQDSCPLCSTDYRISLDRGISDDETNLNISIHHCLGSCQSPKDELWMSFTGSGPRLEGLFF